MSGSVSDAVVRFGIRRRHGNQPGAAERLRACPVPPQCRRSRRPSPAGILTDVWRFAALPVRWLMRYVVRGLVITGLGARAWTAEAGQVVEDVPATQAADAAEAVEAPEAPPAGAAVLVCPVETVSGAALSPDEQLWAAELAGGDASAV